MSRTHQVRHTQLSGTAHTVVKYDTHSCQVRHTQTCHVRSYVNDRSRAIHIQGTNMSRTRLCTIVRD